VSKMCVLYFHSFSNLIYHIVQIYFKIKVNIFSSCFLNNSEYFHAFCYSRFIVENVDEIFPKIEENHHVSSYDIAKELNIDHETF